MHCQINKLSISENTTTPLDLTTIKKESQSTKFNLVRDESEMKDQQTLLNLLIMYLYYHPQG